MKKFYSKNTFFCLPKTHNLLFLFLLTLVSFSSFAQTSPQTFSDPTKNGTATNTFTVPTGVTSITVQTWGAGGGGDTFADRAGGGGAFAQSSFAVTAGTVYTITVGAGASNGTGNNGADSSLGTIVIAKGGSGGTNGGTGGQASASTGTVKFNGGNGGSSTSGGGAGGGGAAGTANSGGVGGSVNGNQGGIGGTGGATGGGDGGAGGQKNVDGSDGFFPGGGGGERGSNGTNSGGGGNGQVIVSWTPCSTATPTGSSFQSFCSVDLPKVSDLSVSGSNIKWYSSISGTTVLSNGTALSSGHYYASQTVSGCESVTRLDVTVNVGAGPSTTGTIICSGSSGTLSASGCGSSFAGTQTAIGYGGTSELTTYKNSNISINFPALPFGATVAGIVTKITYTSNSPSWTNELLIEATPPVALGITKTDLQSSSTSLAPGTVTDGTFGTFGTGSPVGTWLFKFRETYNDPSVNPDANIANVTIIVNYTIPVTVDWYTAASGGTYLGSGTPFNPVGVTGSGLANTNTAGTTIYYAACSTNPSCRTATSFTINSSPTIAAITAPAALCSGGSLNPTAPTVTANGSVLSSQGWQMSTTSGGSTYAALTVPYTVAFGDNGKNIRYTATNACGTTSSNVVVLAVNALPTITAITAPAALCSGNSLNPTAPIVIANGSVLSSQGWEMSTTSGGSTYAALTVPYTVAFGDNGKNIRYTATNACGTTTSNVAVVTVNNVPTIAAITAPAALCSAGSLNPTAPTVTANGSIVTALGWQLETGVGSGTFANLTVPYTVVFTDNGKKIRYYATNGCGTTNSNQVVVTVNNVPTIAAITAPATLCSAGSLNPTAPTVTANGSAVTASGWQLETGVGSGSFANLTGPYTVAFVDSGKKIRYYATSGCGTTNSNQVTLTVEDVLAAPTPGTKTQPNCVITTGSVELSGLPTGSWTVNPGGITGTGSTTTIAGLVVGTYNFTVTNSTGCISSATGNVVINSAVTNTWNGTVWSNGTPTLRDKIVFSGNYPPASDPNPNVDIEGCSCKVTGSTTVVFKAGLTLKITNGVIVQSNATLTFESGASLVQINDTPPAPNSGDIIYKRETTRVSNFDYTYWSTPVSPQTLYNLSPNTLGDKFYSFDSGIDNWRQENSANTMLVGTGYIIRGPQSYAAPAIPNFYPASFMGVPNNGVVKTPIGIAGNSNLIGNPYPSALFADAFISANLGVIEGTIYFWTHNTNIGIGVSNPGSGIYAYSSDDYASYNLTGGVATSDDPTGAASSAGPNTNVPNGMIAAGQAFLTTSVAPGDAVFNNSMRLDNSGSILNNTQFFKVAPKGKTVSTIQKSRLWLNLKNGQGAFKQTLVGYIAGATNDYDSAYDGISYDSNEFIDFYSINQDKNLVIQGRALPFDQADEVPLGYSSTIVGDFQIRIGQVDGSLVDKDVFLEDKLLNTTHNLKMDPYLFKTESGVFNNRFIIKYTNKTLAIDDFDDVKNEVLVSSKNKEIQIKSSNELIDKVVVFDFSGRQLYSKTKVAASDYKIQTLIPADQGLIVKVVLQNGQAVSKKIIF